MFTILEFSSSLAVTQSFFYINFPLSPRNLFHVNFPYNDSFVIRTRQGLQVELNTMKPILETILP